MAVTFCSSGAAVLKAGTNVNSLFIEDKAEATWPGLINQAESLINSTARFNFIPIFSTLNNETKLLLEQTCSDIAAMYAINYDMSGFTTRLEAQTMLDVLRDRSEKGLALIKDQKVETFIKKS